MVNKSNYFYTNIFLAAFFLFVFLIAPVLTFAQIPQSPFTNTQLTETSDIGRAGFGLDQFAVRLASYIAGSLTVLLTFCLGIG